MRVAGIVAGILALLAAVTFGRLTSRRMWRDPAYAEMTAQTMYTRPFSSYATRRGMARGSLPMWAGIGFAGVGVLATTALPSGHVDRTSPVFIIAGVGYALALVGFGLNMWIVWFNRPRLLVPPSMRDEEGLVTAWWRARDLPPDQRRAARLTRRYGPSYGHSPSHSARRN